MTCPDCTRAASEVWGGFTYGCRGCAARAVSRGPNFKRCRDNGRQDRKYQGELRQMGTTHAEVLEQARADVMNKERA